MNEYTVRKNKIATRITRILYGHELHEFPRIALIRQKPFHRTLPFQLCNSCFSCNSCSKKNPPLFSRGPFLDENHDYDFAIAMFLFFTATDLMAALGFVEPVGFPVPFEGLPAGFWSSFKKSDRVVFAGSNSSPFCKKRMAESLFFLVLL